MIFQKKVLAISFAVIIAVAAVFFFVFKNKADTSKGKSSKDSSDESRAAEEAYIPVKVVQAKLGDLIFRLKSPGEAVTNMKIKMTAEVSGVIKSLNVEESGHVKRGEVLVELNDEEYRLALEKAGASHLNALSQFLLEKRFAGSGEVLATSDQEKISKAKEDYEKARKLYRTGNMSREEFEKASKEYEITLIEAGGKKDEILAATKGLTQAEIAVKEAQMNLEKTRIRAPFSGIVCDIKVLPQEYVTASRELFTLVDISQIQVHAKVLESEINKMKVGREVDLKFSAYPGKIFTGKVKAISPIINPEDKTCNVIVDVANPEEEIKPGMHAEVEIVTEIHRNKLLIPQEAILVRTGRKCAFVVEEELAKWRYLDLGLENEDYAEVLNGIKEGEPVIVEGHFTLAHDAKVRVEK